MQEGIKIEAEIKTDNSGIIAIDIQKDECIPKQ